MRMNWQRAAAAGLVQGEQPFEPVKPPRQVPRFLVRANTRCTIKPVSASDNLWEDFRTRKDLPFERFERYLRDEAGSFYEFRLEGWLMLVHRRFVVHREDIEP